MFSNIGVKIQKLATILCWVGIGLSVLSGLIMIIVGASSPYGGGGISALTGVGVMVVGSLSSWIGSFFAYGFGELIVTNQQVRDAYYGTNNRR